MKINGLKISVSIAERGYTNKEFCEKYEIKPATLGQAVKKNGASMLTIVKLSKGLGIPVEEIIEAV